MNKKDQINPVRRTTFISTLTFLARGVRYNMSAHLANWPNLLAGGLGMLINNVIFLTGMWGMLFAGKPENDSLIFYYIALNALVMGAWGGINFFFGGWIDLGELVVNGHFESKLATPRHPLLLVATHHLHPSALGDLVMGWVGIVILALYGPEGMAIRTILALSLCATALFALYIFSGSLAFFIPRGDLVALLIREMSVSISAYPIGKIFAAGWGRILLLLTPAAAISLLPMAWIEEASAKTLLISLASVTLSLIASLKLYQIGVRRYQSLSLIGPQS